MGLHAGGTASCSSDNSMARAVQTLDSRSRTAAAGQGIRGGNLQNGSWWVKFCTRALTGLPTGIPKVYPVLQSPVSWSMVRLTRGRLQSGSALSS